MQLLKLVLSSLADTSIFLQHSAKPEKRTNMLSSISMSLRHAPISQKIKSCRQCLNSLQTPRKHEHLRTSLGLHVRGPVVVFGMSAKAPPTNLKGQFARIGSTNGCAHSVCHPSGRQEIAWHLAWNSSCHVKYVGNNK